MYGNTLTRSLRAFAHMLRRPRDCVRWMRDKALPRTPIQAGLPWISWPCIDFLKKRIRPGWNVFEWGAGGSTLFFLRMGCSVTTVESSEDWIRQVRDALAEGAHSELERATTCHVPAESCNPRDVKAYVAAVHNGAPWDIVVVDGLEEEYLSRVDCVRGAASLVNSGGLIVLDDAWRETYEPVPGILSDYERQEFWGLGPARWGVTKTDVYVAP